MYILTGMSVQNKMAHMYIFAGIVVQSIHKIDHFGQNVCSNCPVSLLNFIRFLSILAKMNVQKRTERLINSARSIVQIIPERMYTEKKNECTKLPERLFITPRNIHNLVRHRPAYFR